MSKTLRAAQSLRLATGLGRCIGPKIARYIDLEVRLPTTGEVVYVIDDDPHVGEALSSLIRANGKRVQTFTSGQAFLEFRPEDCCACVVLDLKMPGMGGLEVQKSISARTSMPINTRAPGRPQSLMARLGLTATTTSTPTPRSTHRRPITSSKALPCWHPEKT